MEIDNNTTSSVDYYKDKLLYIYYQFVRPNGERNMLRFAKIYDELLSSLKTEMDKSYGLLEGGGGIGVEREREREHKSSYEYILNLMYKLIAQTRDICYGKGERDITYMMIYKWWKYYPKMGIMALYSMMFSEKQTAEQVELKPYIDTSMVYIPHQNSFGCFKDVKYFCNYVRKYGDKRMQPENNRLCKYAITMLNQRVYDDYMEYVKNGTLPSLACKWVPRENSKYGWMFEQMAIQWVNATSPVILSSINLEQYENMDVSFTNIKAVVKCKTIYRKVISLLCKQLDIQETKQCNNKWAEINPANLTIDTMFRNNNALFNIDNTCNDRENTVIDKDRRLCAHNIKEHIFMCDISPQLKLENLRKSYLNQNTFSPMQFVKQAMKLIKCRNTNNSNYVAQNILYQIGLLNYHWKTFSKKCNTLDFFIPIVDMSLSMAGDALYNAIGMGCLIAEKSKIGQRVMVMDNIPTWVNLDGCNGDFVEMVEMLYNYTTKNTIANILKTFDVVIHSIATCNTDSATSVQLGSIPDPVGGQREESELPPENVGRRTLGQMDLVFVIFTNESSFWKYENEMIHPLIVERFSDAKLDIPHIVYWNCSPNNVDIDYLPVKPVSGFTNKSSMVSGTNAELLNHFSFIGWGNNYNNTSFDTLENILKSSRYDIMDNWFNV